MRKRLKVTYSGHLSVRVLKYVGRNIDCHYQAAYLSKQKKNKEGKK